MTNRSRRTAKSLAVFSSSWKPREGGAERQVRQICEALSSRGWHIDVITGSWGPAQETARERIRVHPPHGPTNHQDKGVSLLAGSLWRGISTTPDVILASLMSATTVAAATVGRVRHRPVVLRLGGADLERLGASPAGRRQARFVLGNVALIVVNADHLAGQLDAFRDTDLPPVVTIRNGVIPADHQVSNSSSNSRHGQLRALYYTNGGAAKNDNGFLEVVRRCPEVQFRAIGRTDHLPQVPNLTSVGWSDDVTAEIQWADAVINTSFSEGSPNFCLQAIAQGRPVVGYDNPGIQELHSLYPEFVLLVTHGDSDQMQRRLSPALRALTLRVPEVPSIDSAADRWEMVLTRLAGLPLAP